MLEPQFAKMAFNGLHFKIKDYFEDKYFPNLFDLSFQVVQNEQFWKGNEDERSCWSRNKGWDKGKDKIVFLIEKNSAQDEPNTSSRNKNSADEAEVYVA